MNFSQNHCLIEVYKTIIVCLVKSHFSSLPSWDCFKTPFYNWDKKYNLKLLQPTKTFSYPNGNFPEKPKCQNKLFARGQPVQAKEKLIHIAYVSPIKIFEIDCPDSLVIKIEDEHPLTLDIDVNFWHPKSAIDFWIKFQPARRQAGLFFR